MRVDWPRFVHTLAMAMQGRRHGRWRALGKALAFAGLDVDDSTIRGWSNGRSTPRGDVAVWLVQNAQDRGMTVPMRAEMHAVSRGTKEGACTRR